MALGFAQQNVIGQVNGPQQVLVPLTTLKRKWNKVAKMIVYTRSGSAKSDYTKARAYIEGESFVAYKDTGKHLLHFHDNEEELLAEHVKLAYNCGMGVDEEELLAMAQCLRKDPKNVINVGWVQGFLERHPEVARMKASNIDWQRANAANKDNIDKYMTNFKAFIARAKSEGAFTGDYWTKDQVYNYDECCSDPTKARNSAANKLFAAGVSDAVKGARTAQRTTASRGATASRGRARAYKQVSALQQNSCPTLQRNHTDTPPPSRPPAPPLSPPPSLPPTVL